jgi:aminoglycoside 6-adenylyltransferase
VSAIPATYEQLERAFVNWASERSDWRAALVVGSRARSDHPADAWSDLDLIVFVRDADEYVARPDWLSALGGSILLAELEHSARGDSEWIVVFELGLKLDVLFSTLGVGDLPNLAPYQFVVTHGVRIVLDKDQQLAKELAAVTHAAVALPAREAFDMHVDRLWFTALRAAKFIRRGDLWRAKQTCDCELKQSLLTLLEWQTALAAHGQSDTWHDGRYLSEWLEPQLLDLIPATFAQYQADDLWRALSATLELCDRLAREVAGQLAYPYSSLKTGRLFEMIESIQSS